MDPIEKLIFEANTIASIKKGDRISTTQEFINIEPVHIAQALLRAINRDSREKAVICVCQRIDLLIAISNITLESRYLDSRAMQTPQTPFDTPLTQGFASVRIIKDDGRDSQLDCLMIEREKRILVIKKIHMALANASDGIDNLCETYSDDNNVIATLKPLMTRISNQVSILSKYLMEIGEYNDPKTNQLYLNILTK